MLKKLSELIDFSSKLVGHLDDKEVQVLSIVEENPGSNSYFLRVKADKETLIELDKTIDTKPVSFAISIEDEGEFSFDIDIIRKYTRSPADLEDKLYNSHYVVKESKL